MRKPVAITFGVTILVLILFVVYHRYRHTGHPAQPILEAAFLLDNRSAGLHRQNGNILYAIIRETERIEIYQPHLNQQVYRQLKLHRQKAQKIYEAGSWLSENLPGIKDSLYLNGDNLVRRSGKGAENSEPVQVAEIVVSKAHVERVHRNLRQYLNLTSPFSQSPALRRRLQKLKELAETDQEDFYKRVYREPKACLVLAEISLIRSAIMAIEKESLARLGSVTRIYDRSFKSITWVSWPEYVSDKTGTITDFRIRLATAVKLEKWNKPRFRLNGQPLDSVADHSVAFAYFPVSSTQIRNAATQSAGKEDTFSLRIFIPYFDSDTTFTARWIRPIRH